VTLCFCGKSGFLIVNAAILSNTNSNFQPPKNCQPVIKTLDLWLFNLITTTDEINPFRNYVGFDLQRWFCAAIP
jgi:hypothetical protein